MVLTGTSVLIEAETSLACQFAGARPGEGFLVSKPLPFGSKSNVTYGWHCQGAATW